MNGETTKHGAHVLAQPTKRIDHIIHAQDLGGDQENDTNWRVPNDKCNDFQDGLVETL